jgi:hypothetical protein
MLFLLCLVKFPQMEQRINCAISLVAIIRQEQASR